MKKYISILLSMILLLSCVNLKSFISNASNEPYFTLHYTSGTLKFVNPGDICSITYNCYNFTGKIRFDIIATKEYSGEKVTWSWEEYDYTGTNYSEYDVKLKTDNMNPGTYYLLPKVYYWANGKWNESSKNTECEKFTLYIKGEDLDDPNRPIYDKRFSSEWVNGKWYAKDGKLTKDSKCAWHCDSTGWWFTGTNNKYYANCWVKIDRKWYYFKDDGYMAQNEWYDGYWFGGSGAWTYTPTLEWHRDSNGWWIQDTSGWYPRNQWQKVDGVWRYFNSSGYMAVNCYVDGYWLGIDGRYY